MGCACLFALLTASASIVRGAIFRLVGLCSAVQRIVIRREP
jgi:hypothetical protein